jgi:hypothetical protein
MLKHLIAFTAIFCIASLGYSATTKVGNCIKLAADGDSYTFSPGEAGSVKLEFTPTTTGSLFQLRAGSESGTILWETTSTETRAVTSAGIVVTAMGGLNKITDEVTIQAPVAVYLNTTNTAAEGFTGMYLYTGRKEGNN